MSDRSEVLKALLGDLDEATSIASLDDRTRIQKIVYLAQELGVPLGYGFSWYLKGPYSSPLANHYYNMQSGPSALEMKPQYRGPLDRLKAIINSSQKPQGLNKSQWLELVASVRYLMSSMRLDENTLEAKIQREKPNLAPHISEAKSVLDEHFPVGAQEAN